MLSQVIRSFREYLRAPAVRQAQEFADGIEEEIAFHIAERTREYVAGGMTEQEAQQNALKQFGDPARVAVECHAAAMGVPVVWHRLHLGLTMALLLISIGLGVSISRYSSTPPQQSIPFPTSIASMLDNDWSGNVSGQVIDENEQPIRDVNVLVVVKTWPDKSYFQRSYATRTDADGRFQISSVYPLNDLYEVQVTAAGNGSALKSEYHYNCHGTLEPLVLKLSAASGLSLKVISADGESLSGIEVIPHLRIDKSGTEHHVYFDSAQRLTRQTDQYGRVDLPYFQPGDLVGVYVRVSDQQCNAREIFVPVDGKVLTIRMSDESPPNSTET
jgi:hypothetical protein